MILPIYAYGDPVLKKKASSHRKDHPGLKELITLCTKRCTHPMASVWQAPQIGLSLRLFVNRWVTV